MNIKAFGFLFVVLNFLLSSCSYFQEEKILPNEKVYAEDSTLMLNICKKFIEETDVPKLHKAAMATQTIRLINCNDYNNECSLYTKLLNDLVDLSAKGSLEEKERTDLHHQLEQLRTAIESGKKRLHQDWLKKDSAIH